MIHSNKSSAHSAKVTLEILAGERESESRSRRNLNWRTAEFCVFHILRATVMLVTVRVVVGVLCAKSVEWQDR